MTSVKVDICLFKETLTLDFIVSAIPLKSNFHIIVYDKPGSVFESCFEYKDFLAVTNHGKKNARLHMEDSFLRIYCVLLIFGQICVGTKSMLACR
jgi:hypothetical protein